MVYLVTDEHPTVVCHSVAAELQGVQGGVVAQQVPQVQRVLVAVQQVVGEVELLQSPVPLQSTHYKQKQKDPKLIRNGITIICLDFERLIPANILQFVGSVCLKNTKSIWQGFLMSHNY